MLIQNNQSELLPLTEKKVLLPFPTTRWRQSSTKFSKAPVSLATCSYQLSTLSSVPQRQSTKSIHSYTSWKTNNNNPERCAPPQSCIIIISNIIQRWQDINCRAHFQKCSNLPLPFHNHQNHKTIDWKNAITRASRVNYILQCTDIIFILAVKGHLLLDKIKSGGGGTQSMLQTD